jgi:hypothetical protein
MILAWHWGHSTSEGGVMAVWELWIPALAMLLLRFGNAPIFFSVQKLKLVNYLTKPGICLQIPQAVGLSNSHIIT